MREHSIELKDFVSNIQYEVYWQDVEKAVEADIRGWSCGFFRNLFIIAPLIDELQVSQFAEYLAEKAIIKSTCRRTIDQSVVCSIYEREADERKRREFFSEPLKQAHYYNNFTGVHAIDLSEWTTDNDLAYSPDFEKLKAYISQSQTGTRFLLWAKATGDGKSLCMSIPGISFKKIQLPYPNFDQIKAYASLCMKKNSLHMTENVLTAILQNYQEQTCHSDQFMKIEAAVAFLAAQASDRYGRRLSKTDVEKLQDMMASSYIAAEPPSRKIGF